jgi:hypothetical protein
MSALSGDDFKATMGSPMTLVEPGEARDGVPLGGYLAAIPPSDFAGHDFAGFEISKVYRGPTGRFTHVLLSSATPNVFLVIIVDEVLRSVHGHHLLDLSKEYGLG